MSVTEQELAVTQRGFGIYDEFTDSHDNVIRVQQSSNVEGGIWVFCKKYDEPNTDWSPHLSDTDAARLSVALQRAREHQFGPRGCPICKPHKEPTTALGRLRAERGLSGSALANLAGLTKGYISELENGHGKRPSLQTARALAAALDVDIDDVFPEAAP